MHDTAATQLFGRLPDVSARARLYEGYQPLSWHVAARYANRGAELPDLRQVAGIGLLKAIDRYDPRRGTRFTSFAVPTIAGELKRYFRDNLWGTGVPRRLKELKATCGWVGEDLTRALGRTPTTAELAAHIGVPVADIAEVARLANAYRPDSLDVPAVGDTGARGPSPDDADAMGLFDEADAVRSMLVALSPLQRMVLELRFSLEMTQDQIAAKVGISQMQVSRLLQRTLEALRTRMTGAA
ncbi:MAG: sigma-70 family RNA polymerase sigma factor [Acidimicrobiia bacterium]|nr:sigma-70 family RNA polymerase sigma factor [Acidimicrobiia bacterium]